MLNKEDLIKVGTGALIAGVGAGIVYILTTFGQMDYGIFTPAVTALFAILLNFVRKYIKDNK